MTEINVSCCRTINLGNYESIKIQAGLSQSICDGDKRSNKEIFQSMYTECEDFVLDKTEEALNG